MQDVDDFVHFRRCERLNEEHLQLGQLVQVLANGLDGYLRVRDRQANQLSARFDYREDNCVRLAQVVHAQVQLFARAKTFEHGLCVEHGNVARVQAAILQVQVLELLIQAAKYGEQA